MTTGKFDRPTRIVPRKAAEPKPQPESEPLLGSEPVADAPDTVETPVQDDLEARMSPDLVERIEANRADPGRLVKKHDPVAEIEAVEQTKRDASLAAAASLASTDYEFGGPDNPYLAGGVSVEHAEAVKQTHLTRERRSILDRLRGRR